MNVDIYVNMLFACQGMGNLVTITSAGNPKDVVYQALIDFGSTSIRDSLESVKWLGDYLTNDGTKDAYLNLIVVSHKDNDHWSLLPKLYEYVMTRKCKFNVGLLRYGDYYANYCNRAKGVLNKLSEDDPMDMVDEGTFFSDKNAIEPLGLVDGGNVKLIPVAVNVKASVSNQDIVNNTVSLVVAILAKNKNGDWGTMAVLPGDSTADTLEYINQLFADGQAKELKTAYFLSVPHHGALRTISANYDTSKPDLNVAKTFAKSLDACSVGASAGFATHHHPDEGVIDVFRNYVFTNMKEHNYVSYLREKSEWKSTSTEDAIYTTYTVVGSDGKKKDAKKCRVVMKLSSDWTFSVHLLPVDSGGIWSATHSSGE